MATLAERTYAMLGNESLWEAAQRCHNALEAADIPQAVAGGVAVCRHGYRRNTVDVDLVVRSADADRIREVLAKAGFVWPSADCEFRSPTGIPIQFLYAGDRAGKGSEIRLPDPESAKAITTKAGLPVLSLARLIEAKLASGSGSLRRTHKDFADVVELIAVNRLSSSFSRYLHKSVRATFRELVAHANQSE